MTTEERELEQRRIWLRGPINRAIAERAIMQLFYLTNINRERDILMLINSPGGMVDDCFAIFDVLRQFSSQVRTHCYGCAECGALMILAAGRRGDRTAIGESRLSLAPAFQTTTESVPLEVQKSVHQHMARCLAACSNQSTDEFLRMIETRGFINPHKALQIGLIDRVTSEVQVSDLQPEQS